jgi:hypothetical protein
MKVVELLSLQITAILRIRKYLRQQVRLRKLTALIASRVF